MRTAFALILAVVVALPAWAQSFSEGFAAYERGDYAAALGNWRPLADQGDAFAQYNLGVMYATGRGVPQDYAEAVRWYRMAADQGLALAQFNLGTMYGNGLGVPQDYVQAHMWFNLSAAGGVDGAMKYRDSTARRLTPDQLAEAQKLAREWWAEHN